MLKCISQLELAQLFGVNTNKAKLFSLNHFQSHLTIRGPSKTFSLPFENPFSTEKGLLTIKM